MLNLIIKGSITAILRQLIIPLMIEDPPLALTIIAKRNRIMSAQNSISCAIRVAKDVPEQINLIHSVVS